MNCTITNAVLYTIRDFILEYNVTHSIPADETTSVHGCGVKDIHHLAEILGTADSPQMVLTSKCGERTLGKLVYADITVDEKGNATHIAVKSINDRPVVGISWRNVPLNDFYRYIAEVLERNGAYAVYLPKIVRPEGAAKVLSNLDGVLFTGGADINPALYGEKQTPHGTGKYNDVRDLSDILLMKQALKINIPMFAICRSFQMLSVICGGKLIQDVPLWLGHKVQSGEIDKSRVTKVLSGRISDTDEAVKDTGYPVYDENMQFIGNSYDSETDTYMEGTGCREGHLRVEVDGIVHAGGIGFHGDIAVNKNSKWLHSITDGKISLISTSHHQAVNPDRLGKGLTVAAVAADGIVEAIELKSKLFCLGVQYHPEKDALRNQTDVEMNQDECNSYFRTLVKYALAYSIMP